MSAERAGLPKFRCPVLRLPSGQKWIGDESSGYPEGELGKTPPRPTPPLFKERSPYEMYGGGKPNTEI